MRFFYRSLTAEIASRIISEGFAESSGHYWLSDAPPGPSDGDVLEVVVDGNLAEYERTEKDGHREWLAPVSALSKARVRRVRHQPSLIWHRTSEKNARAVLHAGGFREEEPEPGNRCRGWVWVSNTPLFYHECFNRISGRSAGESGALLEIIVDNADGFTLDYEWLGESYREWWLPPSLLNPRIRKIRLLSAQEQESMLVVADNREDQFAHKREQLEALAILAGGGRSKAR